MSVGNLGTAWAAGRRRALRCRAPLALLAAVLLPGAAPLAAPGAADAALAITRTQAPAEADDMIAAAYQTYQAGDPAAAARAYAAALRVAPHNRDAMLGLAACALAANDVDTAAALYRRLALRDPQDALPRAALISIGRARPGRREEDLIKGLLQQHPNDSFLHFTLGRIQAAQAHWPQAQQSFFDAYRLDPANPAHALNLAVSLDRLGYGAAALGYYRHAVALAGQSARPANMEQVLRRIAALSGGQRP